jgi:hypothetical protein
LTDKSGNENNNDPFEDRPCADIIEDIHHIPRPFRRCPVPILNQSVIFVGDASPANNLIP